MIRAMNCYCHLAGQYRGTSWTSLEDFGNQTAQRTFPLGDGERVIQNRYATEDYERYGKAIQPS